MRYGSGKIAPQANTRMSNRLELVAGYSDTSGMGNGEIAEKDDSGMRRADWCIRTSAVSPQEDSGAGCDQQYDKGCLQSPA